MEGPAPAPLVRFSHNDIGSAFRSRSSRARRRRAYNIAPAPPLPAPPPPSKRVNCAVEPTRPCQDAADPTARPRSYSANVTVSAILLDAGGVLLFPQPDAMLPPLRAAGLTPDLAMLERAHYWAMSVQDRLSTPEPQKDTWWRSYLLEYVVACGAAGGSQPDPGIFRIALEAMGVPADDRVLHIGDSLRYDVTGALAAGIRPVHLDPCGFCPVPEGHTHITSLTEIPALVAQG